MPEKSGEYKISPKHGSFKIAVVVHLFYQEQAKGVMELLENIPCEFDLYASALPENGDTIQALLLNFFPDRKIVFRKVRNRGFDVAPFICDFGDCYADYDLVLKIHTKKSSHVFWLKGWGDYLLKNTVGSSKIVENILNMFSEDNRLGIVYPEIVPSLREELSKDFWQENWAICQDLSLRLGLPLRKEMSPDFPAGSMFWFRPKTLAPLFKLGLMTEDFPDGKRIRRNGTLAHAIERLFGLIAKKEGFFSRAVCFEPFKTRRGSSFWSRLQNKTHGEWNRILDFAGSKR